MVNRENKPPKRDTGRTSGKALHKLPRTKTCDTCKGNKKVKGKTCTACKGTGGIFLGDI